MAVSAGPWVEVGESGIETGEVVGYVCACMYVSEHVCFGATRSVADGMCVFKLCTGLIASKKWGRGNGVWGEGPQGLGE